MHLLHTTRLELEEFVGSSIPPYAILSHRWEKEEVSFQDLQQGKATGKVGYGKILGCCAQAIKDRWEYVWVDSCCIDKSSSADLSEAINSMFSWYTHAQVCYAYLSDVRPGNIFQLSRHDFRNSIWFKRGWTLQELLAPQRVEFFNSVWVEIGTKSSLQAEIASITGIDDLFGYKNASVAQKMSWAANRETTRIEDQAYCLMGLFEVNMPPLYGEGRNALIRLQLEILNRTDDETVFAWEPPTHNLGRGLLAYSPNYFGGCGKFKRGSIDPDRLPPTMTSRGLRMELLIFPKSEFSQLPNEEVFEVLPRNHYSESMAEALAPLNCTFGDSDLFLSLPLVQSSTGWTRGIDYMLRTSLSSLKIRFDQGMAEKQVICVKQTPRDPISFSSISEKTGNVIFDFEKLSSAGLSFSQRYFLGSYEHPGWASQYRRTILLKGPWFPDRPAALRLVGTKNLNSVAIIIGKSPEDLFWLDIQPITDSEELQDIAERVALNRKGRVSPNRVH